MTHRRTTIRNAIKTLLDDTTIVAAGKVFTTRSTSFEADSLPVLNILQGPESASRPELAGEHLMRTSIVDVEIVAKGSATEIDVTLDELAEEVEAKMKTDSSLGEEVLDCVLQKTSAPEFNTESQTPFGRVTLSYAVQYQDEE